MCECVFCHKEQIITDFVYEDELVMAFMDMEPINEGHILLVPKQHYLDADEIPDDLLAYLMLVSKKIVKAFQMVIVSCKMVVSSMMLDTIICISFQDMWEMVLAGLMVVKRRL